jgi:hypothetical protein
MSCWSDISQFQQFLQCMLAQLGPLAIQGVTDGSNAKAGFVGEFLTGSAQINFPAGVSTTTPVQPLVVSPGDWDISAYMIPSVAVNFLGLVLSPIPAGMSNSMQSQQGSPGTDLSTVSSMPARGNFTVPTLLAFSTTVSATATAGYFDFVVSARRRR